MRRQFLARMAAMAASTIAAPYSFAQSDYPNKPIRVLIGLAPGGSTDPVMRLIQPKLQEILGQPITIENRPGAGTGIAAGMVTAAQPDGYTLLFTAAGTHVIHTIGVPSIKYDPVKDFTAIAATSRAGWCLVVHNSIPAKTLPEFIAYCKANPGKLSYASGGVGNANHLAFERLNHATGIKTVHVPYKAGNTAMADFIAGRVHAYFTTVAVVQSGIQMGALRVLAYAASGFNEVPGNLTFAAGGLPQFDSVSSTTCLLGPPGLPTPIVNRLASAVERVIALPEIKTGMVPLQHNAFYAGPQPLLETMRREYEENKQIIKDANIKLEG